MEVTEIISEVTKNGVKIQVLDNSLRLIGKDGSLPIKLQEEIRKNKPEIINFINGLKREKTIHKTSEKDQYCPSSGQKGLYFLFERDKSSLAYNMPYIARLEGKLDRTKLVKAFENLIVQHESLRTTFKVVGGELFQEIHEKIEFEVECFESSESDVRVIVNGFVQPFDLYSGPLIRVD